MAGKISPRQKMINMMYLVLTAMLALNVSREILHAFVVVNIGLLQQNENLQSKNSSMYAQFNQEATIRKDDPKIQYLQSKANEVKQLSGKLSELLAQMKIDIIHNVDGIPKSEAENVANNPGLVENKKNYDAPTRYFGTDDVTTVKAGNGKASELKRELTNLKKKYLQIVSSVAKKYYDGAFAEREVKLMKDRLGLITLDLSSKDKKKYKYWEMKYFYHLPLSAALVELTKWENIVEGSESEMLSFLWDQIGATSFKFDRVEAKLIPTSGTYVTTGSTYKAEVFLAAFSTSAKPKIVIGTDVDSITGEVTNPTELPKTQIKDGKGYLNIPATGTGIKQIGGVIKIKEPTSDKFIPYPFSASYVVAPPSATVSPTKMNVFYRGLKNPLKVAVPGVANENVSVSISNASLSNKGGGEYIVKPGGGNKSFVNVNAEMADGSRKTMARVEFRVKSVPTPTIFWAGRKDGGTVTRTRALVSPVVPKMLNFMFDVYSRITSMTVEVQKAGNSIQTFRLNSNVISGRAKQAIQSMPSGAKVFFRCKMSLPGGDRRTETAQFTVRN